MTSEGYCPAAMERSMRMLVIYPQQQRLWCAVTRVVDEESRDVRAGVLRYLIS